MIEKVKNSSGEALRRAGRHQSSGLAIDYDLGRSAHGCRKHRHLHRQCFERGIGQAFSVRRQHHEVGILQEAGGVADVTREMNSIGQSGGLDALFEVCTGWALPREHGNYLTALRLHQRQRIDQVGVPLLRAQSPDADDYGRRQAFPDQRLQRAGPARSTVVLEHDGIVEQHHFRRRYPAATRSRSVFFDTAMTRSNRLITRLSRSTMSRPFRELPIQPCAVLTIGTRWTTDIA